MQLSDLIENFRNDLIELKSQIWKEMSDAQREQYYRDKGNSAIGKIRTLENIIYLFHKHSEEFGNPGFEALFGKKFRMKINCFDNFWEELDNAR